MQFLVEFEVEVPARTLDQQVEQHQRAESAAAAKLAEDGRSSSLTRASASRPLWANHSTSAISPGAAGESCR
jgi:muconolactone delta-isomerase